MLYACALYECAICSLCEKTYGVQVMFIYVRVSVYICVFCYWLHGMRKDEVIYALTTGTI